MQKDRQRDDEDAACKWPKGDCMGQRADEEMANSYMGKTCITKRETCKTNSKPETAVKAYVAAACKTNAIWTCTTNSMPGTADEKREACRSNSVDGRKERACKANYAVGGGGGGDGTTQSRQDGSGRGRGVRMWKGGGREDTKGGLQLGPHGILGAGGASGRRIGLG